MRFQRTNFSFDDYIWKYVCHLIIIIGSEIWIIRHISDQIVKQWYRLYLALFIRMTLQMFSFYININQYKYHNNCSTRPISTVRLHCLDHDWHGLGKWQMAPRLTLSCIGYDLVNENMACGIRIRGNGKLSTKLSATTVEYFKYNGATILSEKHVFVTELS